MSIQARNARLHAICNHQETLKRRRAALNLRISEEEHFRFATLCPLPPQDQVELQELNPPAEEVLAEMRKGALSGEWGDEGAWGGEEEEGDEWCGYRADPMEIDAWDGAGEQGVGVGAEGMFEIESDDEDEGSEDEYLYEDDDEDKGLYDDEDEDIDISDSEQDSATPSDSGSDMDSADTPTGDLDLENDAPEDVPPIAYLGPVIVFSDGPPDTRSSAPTNLDAPPSDIPLPPLPPATLPPTPPPRPARREPPRPPDPGPTTAETLLEFEASYNEIYNAGASVWYHCRFQEYLREEAFRQPREREGRGPRGPSGLRNEVLPEEVGVGWGWGSKGGW